MTPTARVRRAAVALAVALAVPFAGGAPASAAPVSSPAVAAPVALPVVASPVSGPAQDLLDRLNAARAQAGVPALVADASLTSVAQGWSHAMAASGTMAHNPNVSAQIPAGWQSWGENVAWNLPADAARMHSQWWNSAGHQANMLNPRFTHVGIGWVVDGSGRAWGTQVFATYPSGAALPRFADVPFDHTFHPDIEWAATRGVANGYSGGVYRPSGDVSRQAMAAFLHRATFGGGDPACTGSARTFKDVPASSPFCGVIESLAARGVVTGHSDGTFRPLEPVTRQATAAFLHRAAGGTSAPCSTTSFPDVPSDSPFCTSVRWLSDSKITGGYADGTFRPNATVTRQAMAAFLHRAG